MIGAAAAAVVAMVGLTSCVGETEEPTTLPPAPSGSESAAASAPVQPVGTPADVATGLQLPWSIAFLDDGTALISERDTALVKELSPDGAAIREVGQVPDVVPGGEGGLLGLATLVDGATTWLYAYTTAESDNRVVRMPINGSAGSLALGEPEVVVDGIAKAGNHNGGRIKFGPDGMLYVTAGDAGRPDRAQDEQSLNGKILRMTPTGDIPADNPFGNLVWSMGHRNPQGIAWDDDGQLWAAEFGQDTWDEVNRIDAGANYGWPVVEGIGDDPEYTDPEYQWATSEASPSGLAFVRGTFFLAALRGQRVWALNPGAESDQVPYFQGQYGRMRDVVEAPDGDLWMLTSNTGGNGEPRDGDDRLVEVQLAALPE